jgi:excinuclease ABC subunit C
MVSSALAQRIRQLPDRPGIYIFRDAEARPLYVGKASSLRKRAATYLSGQHEARIGAMLREAVDVEVVVTDTAAEALLLENNWIKSRRPRYNILLRDDKTYPYVKLTREDYPRVAFTRRIRRDGAEYFGPYLPGGLARRAIKLVQKLFEIRVCRIDIDGSLPRPCLYHDMRRCLGPCVDGLTTKAAYDQAVVAARLFLAGRNDELLKTLRQEMVAQADSLQFERAAQIRDLIHGIESVTQQQKLSSVRGEDVDVYGVQATGGDAAICALVMRGGQVLDRRELFWEGRQEVSKELVLSEMLPQIYERTTFIPREIHLPFPIEGQGALAEWLSERKGERVYIRLPSRGPKAQRVALAQKNAALAHRRRFRTDSGGDQRAAQALQEHLGLPEAPLRIEGFDVATLHGSETVASLVVWEQGRMQKSEYRSFNIRNLQKADDLASIRQAVERRYRRRLDELGAMPDLILIDGGRGQLNAALSALVELGVEETSVVALAKANEELYLPDRPEAVRLPRRDAGLRLLQQLRDEAHRFALSRHRRRRSKTSLASELDGIPGIGPRRRKLLLRQFGSVGQLRTAPRDELVTALGPVLGGRVFDQLNDETGRSEG